LIILKKSRFLLQLDLFLYKNNGIIVLLVLLLLIFKKERGRIMKKLLVVLTVLVGVTLIASLIAEESKESKENQEKRFIASLSKSQRVNKLKKIRKELNIPTFEHQKFKVLDFIHLGENDKLALVRLKFNQINRWVFVGLQDEMLKEDESITGCYINEGYIYIYFNIVMAMQEMSKEQCEKIDVLVDKYRNDDYQLRTVIAYTILRQFDYKAYKRLDLYERARSKYLGVKYDYSNYTAYKEIKAQVEQFYWLERTIQRLDKSIIFFEDLKKK